MVGNIPVDIFWGAISPPTASQIQEHLKRKWGHLLKLGKYNLTVVQKE